MLDQESCRLGDLYFISLFNYLEYDSINGTDRIECKDEDYISKKEMTIDRWNHHLKTQSELLEAISHAVDLTDLTPLINQEMVQEAVCHANKYCLAMHSNV